MERREETIIEEPAPTDVKNPPPDIEKKESLSPTIRPGLTHESSALNTRRNQITVKLIQRRH
ncbi:hypothetical protein HY345_04460 [Candidatus Microgenomates bacterium]|nr:hypothetical protein [Candidatus Microgenomates bacterium]